MDGILITDRVSEHDAFYHMENLHPLVSIVDFDGNVLTPFLSLKTSFIKLI